MDDLQQIPLKLSGRSGPTKTYWNKIDHSKYSHKFWGYLPIEWKTFFLCLMRWKSFLEKIRKLLFYDFLKKILSDFYVIALCHYQKVFLFQNPLFLALTLNCVELIFHLIFSKKKNKTLLDLKIKFSQKHIICHILSN
jgi:hypothetical protein